MRAIEFVPEVTNEISVRDNSSVEVTFWEESQLTAEALVPVPEDINAFMVSEVHTTAKSAWEPQPPSVFWFDDNHAVPVEIGTLCE